MLFNYQLNEVVNNNFYMNSYYRFFLYFSSILLLANTSCLVNKNLKPTKQPIPQLFKVISTTASTFNIDLNGFVEPAGGHIQGVQRFKENFLIVSGSSESIPYFLVVQLNGERGKVIKMIEIQKDFPNMQHNHASGIQLMGNLLVIGTEGGNDPNKSSLVFYNLANPFQPKALKLKIDRQQDTAGAIGMILYKGKILVAVGGWDADRIDFYKSNTANFKAKDFNFDLINTWQTQEKDYSNWINERWGTYQSLNFMQDQKVLYIIGFYRDELEQNWADLYQVNMNEAPSRILKKINEFKVDKDIDISFKNGGGLFYDAKTQKIQLLATARNWASGLRIKYW